jgi:hypothetical protein
VRDSVKDYVARGDRPQWVLNWPGQVVLAVSQIYWTTEVAEAIRKAGFLALAEYHDDLMKQLLAVTALVRGKLTKMNAITLGALITIDVHARDVVQSMVDAKVSTENDFEWISQLRYYWENDGCVVKQVDNDFDYGYEVTRALHARCTRVMPARPPPSLHVHKHARKRVQTPMQTHSKHTHTRARVCSGMSTWATQCGW